MKKPVKRVSLLEDLLSDFIEIEDILLKLELTNELQPLSAKQKQLHKEIVESSPPIWSIGIPFSSIAWIIPWCK